MAGIGRRSPLLKRVLGTSKLWNFQIVLKPSFELILSCSSSLVSLPVRSFRGDCFLIFGCNMPKLSADKVHSLARL